MTYRNMGIIDTQLLFYSMPFLKSGLFQFYTYVYVCVLSVCVHTHTVEQEHVIAKII